MKKQMILPLLAVWSLCIVACSKTSYRNAPSPRVRLPVYPAQVLADSSGSIHNAVLGMLYNGAGTFRSLQDFAHYLVDGANRHLVAGYDFAPLPESFMQSSEADALKLMSNNFYLLQKPRLDSLMNSIIDGLVARPDIDSGEKSLFNQSRHIFDADASMNEQTVLDSVIARSTRLLDMYHSRSWPGDAGHAIGGFLNIARSSAQFWKAHRSMIESKLLSFPFGWSLPQLDAAGYIFGWAKAWLWDELDTPKERIGAGLAMAAEWSGISGWFK